MSQVRAVLQKVTSNRKIIYAALIFVCIVQGLLVSYFTHDNYLHTGDNATFYAFARSLSKGEVIYKDFIHFRTPGSYWLQALSIDVFGDSQRSVELAIKIETTLLYPLTFLLSAMIIFRKKSIWFVVFALLAIFLLPAYTQLRAGLGLLAISCLFAAISTNGVIKTKRWLLASGVLTGLTFTFGQEIALMVAICILASELWAHGRDWRKLLTDAKVLAIGLAIGLAPLFIYVVLKSDIMTFVYYVTYYSFILQPRYMNTAFPGLGYQSFLYYIPFIIYLWCFVVLYLNSRLGKKEALLLSFGFVRLITLLGRSDFGHLLFAIPELFIITPLFMSETQNLSKVYLRSKELWLSFSILLLLIVLSINLNSIFMALIPFVVIGSIALRQKQRSTKTLNYTFSATMYLGLGSMFILLNFLLFPYYISGLKTLKRSIIQDDHLAYRISGVKTDTTETFMHIQEVKREVDVVKPDVIFSYPIQPFYYSFAPHHASRFFTFEPQTTVAEQEETILDLKATKPAIVLFDPLQAQSLSGSLWLINNYLTSNYELKKEIVNKEIVWVMTPKQKPALNEKLVFSLFRENKPAQAGAIQNTKDGLVNAISQGQEDLNFTTETQTPSELALSIYKAATQKDVCGEIVITTQKEEIKKMVCARDGKVVIPIEGSGKTSIRLINRTSSPINWNDPTIQAQ